MANIPFNKPFVTGQEIRNINRVQSSGALAGDGFFTKACHHWLEEQTGCCKALLTHSCTAALEMTALLADIQPGDEVIMPSYTFVSTANAFALRGGVPVFVDIRPDTLNLDERLIEAAITPRTRVIVPVHYAGVGCAMDEIIGIAHRHNLLVVEDAAQGVMAQYKGKALGTLGDLGCFSFHETKNVIAGEGGALLVNDERFFDRAEIMREKGTNRSQFFRGMVDKYTWVDLGSSYLPGELVAAFLAAQLEDAAALTSRRLQLWERYHSAFLPLEEHGVLSRPVIPVDCTHNAHMYYLLVSDLETRTALINHLRHNDISAVFHYVPLHSSPAGRKYGRPSGDLALTTSLSERVVRLPLWIGLDEDGGQEQVIAAVTRFFQ